MNIVILGAGVVGSQIAAQLVSEKHDVVIIERNPDRAKYVSSHVDCLVINEEGNNINTLKKAGIEYADFFLSVVDSDEINMLRANLTSLLRLHGYETWTTPGQKYLINRFWELTILLIQKWKPQDFLLIWLFLV